MLRTVIEFPVEISEIRTLIQNQSGEDQEIELVTAILDPTGKQVGLSSTRTVC